MSERHPDIFTPEEAAEYLHLPSTESLRTLSDKFGLVARTGILKFALYSRADLDRCALLMQGIDPTAGKEIQKPLRLAGGRNV